MAVNTSIIPLDRLGTRPHPTDPELLEVGIVDFKGNVLIVDMPKKDFETVKTQGYLELKSEDER